MDSALVAALQGIAPTVAVLVRITLPTTTFHLTDQGAVAWDGQVYLADDPVAGALGVISGLVEGANSATTRVTITLAPPSELGVADLTAPDAQGSAVEIWWAAVNPATGQVIGEPYPKFQGELDLAEFDVGGGRGLTLNCGTQAERQLEPNEDWRLNHPFHSAIWPGETGLSAVTDVRQVDYWRAERPSAITYG